MMSEYANPLELAKEVLGEHFDPDLCPPVSPEDQRLSMELHTEARMLGFMGTNYWVRSVQGFLFPKGMDEKTEGFDGKLRYMLDIDFAGTLEGFNKFSLGKKFGSWFLYFGEATLVPHFESPYEDDELWIPTASMRKIEPL